MSAIIIHKLFYFIIYNSKLWLIMTPNSSPFYKETTLLNNNKSLVTPSTNFVGCYIFAKIAPILQNFLSFLLVCRYWSFIEKKLQLTEQSALEDCTHPESSFLIQQAVSRSLVLVLSICWMILLSTRMQGANLAPKWIKSAALGPPLH